MIWKNWFPWKFIVRRLARTHGFLDPIALLARLEQFAQPSEVAEPIELLRAGVILHARGLINSRVIQHNLDWVWPYWVERQFDPKDKAFVPRAFSITNINLTNRNWTAIGVPDSAALPIVDPRGLLTPHLDGWSIDGWIVAQDGRLLLPSRLLHAEQSMALVEELSVITESVASDFRLISESRVESGADGIRCLLKLEARADTAAWLVVSLRPYNPEGVSFVHEIELDGDRKGWKVNGEQSVRFSDPLDAHRVSDYRAGDVFIHLREREEAKSIECSVGMATAAAIFDLVPGQVRNLTVEVPVYSEDPAPSTPLTWTESLESTCRLETPDKQIQFLYDAAIRSLVLHSPTDVYPGPYTYKRFWFRDAAFIINALLAGGMLDRARRALDRFPARQNPMGFFHSQDGEWDSNGEALWIFHRYCRFAGIAPPVAWRRSILNGARWISRKRLPEEGSAPHAGLMPAGFSAEHLGPNDYYYWDDFWSVAGLHAAAGLLRSYGDEEAAAESTAEAGRFMKAIERSLQLTSRRLGRHAIPASPYRRLDAGTVGSIVCGYPLELVPCDDPRLLDTVNFLLTNCFVDGAFFQDMIHSGLNVYLTLQVAQVLLRAGNPRFGDLIGTVADLASPTGQWPEAIHPLTGGGCMGDGHHVWASAEWVLMIRNCLLREGDAGFLIVGSGIQKDWITTGSPLRFGPAPTIYGPIRLELSLQEDRLQARWSGEWFADPPRMDFRIPGWEAKIIPGKANQTVFERRHRS